MKYFTKELWLGYNSRNDAERQRAFVKGEDNAQEYKRQLEDLRPRLTREAYDFFTTESLHDGRLLAFTAGDAIDYGIQGHADRFDINIHNPAVEIELLGANLDVQYTLKYGSVRKVVFDHPTDVPLFHHEGGHIGDWGYDEVTAADENYLRHEVLFSSGTTILIEFTQFSFERQACEGTRYL